MPADGRKVKGTIHWLSARHAADITVRLYEPLLTLQNPSDIPEDKEYADFMNENSVVTLTGCKAEPTLIADEETHFQFVRTGYFVRDCKTPGVYNRTVSLKDSFKPQ